MQELVGEFEEKVCEIIADTIFNSIKRHQIYYSQNKQVTDKKILSFTKLQIIQQGYLFFSLESNRSWQYVDQQFLFEFICSKF